MKKEMFFEFLFTLTEITLKLGSLAEGIKEHGILLNADT
jgi:hypothetical protein